MANDLVEVTRLSQRWRMAADIQNQQRVKSTLTSLTTNTIVTFWLNPNSINEESNPVQSVFATAASFHVYRWMNEPTKWTIQGYAGLDGMNLHSALEQMIGETNVRWHYPYLGADKFVRIDKVSLPLRGTNPFSVYYSVDMQELTPKLNLALINTILPNRITPGFVSPNTAALANVLGSTSIGSVPVLPEWSSLQSAVNFIFQQNFSRVDQSTLADKMQTLNHLQNNFWLNPPLGLGPINADTGEVIQDFLFPIVI